ncbi:MAG: hypothetical protein ACE5IK_04705 [Acidobacteriota bacterium]
MRRTARPTRRDDRRFAFWLAAVAIPVLALSQTGSDRRVLAGETALRPVPGGEQLAGLLTSGTPVTILERHGNWVHVQVDGWIPQSSLGDVPVDDSPVPQAGVPAPSPAIPNTRPHRGRVASAGTTRIEGQVSLRLGRRQQAPVAGLEIMLLPAAFQPESRPEEMEQLATLDTEINDLQRRADRAMQEDNFTQAMARRDALVARRTDVLARRAALLAAMHGRHQVAARSLAIASAAADSQGWFSLNPVAADNYTVYARLIHEGSGIDVEWVEPITATGDVVRLDLDESSVRGRLTGPE